MDYWPHLDVTTYLDFDDFLAKNAGAKIYMATTKARQVYTDVHYRAGLLYHVRKRECRDPGRNFKRTSGYCSADTDAR